MRAPGIFFALFFVFVGCHSRDARQGAQSIAEALSASDGSVGFDVTPSSSAPDGTAEWAATYATKDGVSRFKFRLSPAQSRGDGSFGDYSVGKGIFIAVDGSNPEPLLEALKTALQANTMPQHVRHQHTLPFTYAVFGDGWNRAKDGGFDNKKQGTWTPMKIFLTQQSEGDTEVFLNLSPATGKGEFAIKDPDYGDNVLRALAKVL